MDIENWKSRLQSGLVIPACPLSLTEDRRLHDACQRNLLRYYMTAGAGGIAVGVHTTQFAIRDPSIGLFRPVVELAANETQHWSANSGHAVMLIGGVCGPTSQAVSEAELLRACHYQAGLLSLSALKHADEDQLISHCRTIAEIIPVFGFYLQPAVGGRVLTHSFWRRFAEIENVVAIKIAPFNRYQTIDVVRAIIESGRSDIALYTGNDDNIVADLLTPFRFQKDGQFIEKQIVGGLLGQWAVGTHAAVRLHRACREYMTSENPEPGTCRALLQRGAELTDFNAAMFDAADQFHGCIPGIHSVLMKQQLLPNLVCLDPEESLSAGQQQEIDRVCKAWPWILDTDFLQSHSLKFVS